MLSMYIFEFIGTAVLVLLGCGSVANNHLPKTGGNNAGTLFINTGWGFAVFVAVLCTYKRHYDECEEPAKILGTFSTGPGIAHGFWNIVTEIIGTFILVFAVILFGVTENAIPPWAGAVTVGFLVWVIGISLGGPTGYAINPARDLGPRMFHAVARIPNKGSSNWSYGLTIPVLGPVIGGILAALASTVLGV